MKRLNQLCRLTIYIMLWVAIIAFTQTALFVWGITSQLSCPPPETISTMTAVEWLAYLDDAWRQCAAITPRIIIVALLLLIAKGMTGKYLQRRQNHRHDTPA